MSAETEHKAEAIRSSLALLRQHLGWDKSLERLAELQDAVEDQDLWNDQQKAQSIMREKNSLEVMINDVNMITRQLDDAMEMVELAEAEGDEGLVEETLQQLIELEILATRKQLESLLSGEADGNDCFIEINAGAGGTEAQDWAQMLVRMYSRWAEQHSYKIEYIEESPGEEAGIKSVTMRFNGERAYGWMKTESGVHRLVRISPYDSSARRHTSFASVWVYPVVDDAIEIEIDEKDLRIDTYRASGAGGQHVNKTDSAIRITHLPTGIVVQCQNDRSQHRNRATAYNMLKARLYENELQKREAEANASSAAKTDIGWGNQIRSYVLHPYQMVKDLRTQVEKGNAQGVLDGDIDDFLEAGLAQRLGK
jgi:peptide chain release factor 2